MRALVADDDRVSATIVARSLRQLGLDVVVAHDGNEAARIIHDDASLSIAVLDWMMPGVDGLELCRRIRQDEARSRMHVILVTARDGRADLIAGLDAGADDYIVKPFDLEELRARVHVGIRVGSLQERLASEMAQLQAARDELARLERTDVLTELCSRRHWFEAANNEWARYRRYHRPFGLLMADLDFFKRVNDTFGHGAGDRLLRQFADLLRAQCRSTDLPGRVGGEEFAVLLPETSIEMAREMAQRIVESCRTQAMPSPSGPVTFSCSIGVAAPASTDNAIEDVLGRADAAMYAAKRHGRDRVEVSDSDADTKPALSHVA